MELKLLDEVDGNFEHAAVLTYTLQLDWIEKALLARLPAVRNRIVVADHQQMLDEMDQSAQIGAVRAANRAYLVAAARAANRFHPKVLLLAGENHGRLFVGSGNATMPGMAGPGEQYALYRYPEDGPNPFTSIAELLRHLTAGVDPLCAERLNLLLSRVDWLGSGSSHLSPVRHNLHRSLLDQLVAIVGSEPVFELTLLAPYFDPALVALRTLIQRLKPRSIEVLVQPEFASIDARTLERLASEFGIKVRPVDRQKTRLHAKFYLLRLESRDVLLSGSANCTSAALLRTSADGNVEVANLVTGPRGAYSHLIDGVAVGAQVTDVAGMPMSIQPSKPSQRGWHLLGCEIAENRLVLSLDGAKRVIVKALVDDQPVPIVGEWPTFAGDLTGAAASVLEARLVAVRVVTSDNEFSNAVFPRVMEDLEHAWGAPDPRPLSRLGDVDLGDDELFERVAMTAALLLLEGLPTRKAQRARQPESSDTQAEVRTIGELLVVDLDELARDPRYAQYMVGAEHVGGRAGHTAAGVLRSAARRLLKKPAAPAPREVEEEPEREREELERDSKELERRKRAWGRSWTRRLAGAIVRQCSLEGLAPEILARNHAIVQQLLLRFAGRPWIDLEDVLGAQLRTWDAFWGWGSSKGWFFSRSDTEQLRALEAYEDQAGEPYLVASLLLAAGSLESRATQERLTSFARRVFLKLPIAIVPKLIDEAGHALAACQGLEIADTAFAWRMLTDFIAHPSDELLMAEIADLIHITAEQLRITQDLTGGVYVPTIIYTPDDEVTVRLEELTRLLRAWMTVDKQPCYRIQSGPWLLMYEMVPTLLRVHDEEIQLLRYARHDSQEVLLALMPVTSLVDRVPIVKQDVGDSAVSA